MSVPALFSIEHIFASENECISFLFEEGILYEPTRCERCSSKLYRDKIRFCCLNKKCRKSVSIFKDSFFAKNHIDCNKAMMIGYLWLCKSSYTSIRMITGHSPGTISSYMRFFREMVIDTLRDSCQKIGGKGIVVEIDESKFGKRKNYRGRRVDGVWVIGGVEKTSEKRCFLKKVKKRDWDTIQKVIKRYVKKGSIVGTDCWPGYDKLRKSGVFHETVNHSKHFKDPDSGVHINTIEGTWNGIKLQISPRNRNKCLIEGHLFEFIWRRSNKGNLWEAFIDALRSTAYYE